MSEESRAFKKFTRGISRDTTLYNYTISLYNFAKFHNFGESSFIPSKKYEMIPVNYDKMALCSGSEIDTMMEDYIDDFVSRKCKAITIRSALSGVERFFTMQDAIWHKERIRLCIPKDDDISGGGKPIHTDTIRKMLTCTNSLRTIALVHFLASTGCRPGGLIDPVLHIKHLYKMPIYDKPISEGYCYAVLIYAGFKEEYWAFLTPEATKALDSYFDFRSTRGEKLSDESPVFTTKRTTSVVYDYMTDNNVRYILYNLMKQSGVLKTKINPTRFDLSVIYGFRKRFDGKLKMENSVNSNIAEKLMAHKKGLDGVYLKPTREECYAEFVKAIPNLTIDPTERQKVEIDNQKQEIKNLEVERDEIKRLEQSNNSLQDSIQIQKQESSDEQKRLLQILDDMQNQINNLKK